MAASDADAAARLIERLLADPAFRADFRRDPAAACRAAGLDELAEEMAFGAGKAMQTLEVRESRSSLAGVMMAAALEGIGVLGFVQHVVPAAAAAPGAVRDVLSRVNLPKIGAPLEELRGALAQRPQAPAAAPGAGDEAADVDAAAPAPAPAAAAPAAPPAPAAAPTPGDAAAGDAAAADATPASGDAAVADADATATSGDAADGRAGAPPVAPAAATAEDVIYEEAAPDEIASPGAPVNAAPPSAVSAVDAQPSGTPVDPAQFGTEGTGGAPDPAALALLENKNVVLDGNGVADIKAGRIDPRIVAVLTKISEKHKVTVSCMCSDHAKLTTGGSVSNHHFGRGIDISAIDGAPVNADNAMAHEVAADLASLDESYRPTEIGTPWAFQDEPPYFSDAGHSDHLHVAFDGEIERAWAPPAEQPAASAAPPIASAAPPVASAAPPVASAAAPAAAAPGGFDTLSITLPEGARASKAARDTLGLELPEAGGTPRTAPAAVAADAARASAAADVLAGGEAQTAAGAKALGALAEAMKYKNTDYQWGGSTPETGFDCSGLVQWAYAKQGIEIPRVTDQQILAKNGTSVDRTDLAPGDLVFFRDGSGYVHHVGISMGGDKFLHAPHTGDVVKESSLDESHYAKEFAGGRRFDDTPVNSPAAAPAPAAVDAAHAALTRDAAAARDSRTLVFEALVKQEASFQRSTVQFLPAVRPEQVRAAQPVATPAEPVALAAQVDPAAVAGSLEYPGNDATKQQLAAWLAASAQQAGLPPELPVMAALVESGVANLSGGHADSAGFFQMRVGIWDKGEYLGYRDKPELQMKWFIDHALDIKQKRLAAGDADFGTKPSDWGNWIADVERPLESLRGRYQDQLGPARQLLGLPS